MTRDRTLDRRCRRVEVPQPVVHHLEVPDPLTALGVAADYALAEEIVAGALVGGGVLTALEVRGVKGTVDRLGLGGRKEQQYD